MMALFSMFGSACSKPTHAAEELPKPQAQYAPDKAAKAGETKTMVVAGGCFWCVEGVFEQLDGVKDASSGYAGGPKETANYKAVCGGDTGHAEAVKIVYDPAKITYGELLRVFFTTHDPTTKDRQGNDVGTQYRSAIFPLDDEQKAVAEAYIKQLNDAKAFDTPIVTTVEPLKMENYYPAEDYHQDYVRCNPNNRYIQGVALPKVEKVREKFANQLKKDGAEAADQPTAATQPSATQPSATRPAATQPAAEVK
jgi:peptide-methionine (S)-S-oxide reductase